MSCPNFCTMRDFPLFARDFYTEVKRCADCGAIIYDDTDVCPVCGSDDLEDDTSFDDFLRDEIFHDVGERMEELNRDLLFHKTELRGGYWTGAQFYVETEHDLDGDDYDNEDCRYYFDLCRSAARRKYASEQRKITRALRKLAQEYGFEEYHVVGTFSNGEAHYRRVENR